MVKLTKRQKATDELVDKTKMYDLKEAVSILKQAPKTKFDETVEVAMKLTLDQASNPIRGTVSLPHGTGKEVRVAVFTAGANADAAKEAGADFVGMEDLAEQVKGGMMDFDVVIASPDAMRVVGQLGQVLGPRGLMPNPKTGTVTPDVAKAVKEVKAGKIDFRVDKTGIVHASLGKLSFTDEQLVDNIKEFLKMIMKLKPSAAKGTYVKSLFLSSTMGPGLQIAKDDVLASIK